MSMSQTEWAARVAAIGELAGWPAESVHRYQKQAPRFEIFEWIARGENPAVILAIRQLAADWLGHLEPPVVAVRVCRWEYHEHTCHWDGECGIAWTMIDGGLAENHVNYCPKCGGEIEVAP